MLPMLGIKTAMTRIAKAMTLSGRETFLLAMIKTKHKVP